MNHPEPAQQDELRGSSSPGQGQTAEERVGVLLLNLGGPETLNDVQPFLFNLFRDPDIIRLPQGSESRNSRRLSRAAGQEHVSCIGLVNNIEGV